jgi:asparagine synthetase B (glutamine-hydrolysing)
VSGGFLVAVPKGGRRVAPELLARLLAVCETRTPGRVHHVLTDDGVLVVAMAFETTPEQAGEVLPLASPDGQVLLAYRGYVANIDELRRQLAPTAGTPLRSDGDVLLAGYLRWGDDLAGRVVGECSWVVWDGHRKRLVGARDHLGLRPLLIHDGPEWFVVGVEPSQLRCFPGCGSEVDLAVLADILTGAPNEVVRTPLVDVRRLHPATVLVRYLDGRMAQRRYWTPERTDELLTGDPHRFLEPVYEVVETAILQALRAKGPVAAWLSGGLDSSSIVGVIDKALRDGTTDADVRLVSLRYPGRDCDEGPYIKAVVDRCGLPAHEFDDVGPPNLDSWLRSMRESGALSSSDSIGTQAAREWHRSVGGTVSITGHGGDGVFWSPTPVQLVLRRTRPLRAAMLEARVADPLGPSVRNEVVPALVPDVLRRAHQRLHTRRHAPLLSARADVLCRSLAGRRPVGMGDVWAHSWFEGRMQQYLEGSDAQAVRTDFETRLPLIDPRVLDHVGGLPAAVHGTSGANRWLQRAAFEAVMPRSSLGRGDKAEFASVLADQLRAALDGRLDIVRSLTAVDLTDGRVLDGWLARSAQAQAESAVAQPLRLKAVISVAALLSAPGLR